MGSELVLVAGLAVNAFDPTSGKLLWQGPDRAAWSVATDGKTLYALRPPTSDDKTKPVAIEVLPQPSGKKNPPVLTLPSFDGTPEDTQLLCIAADTAYMFAKSATTTQWFLIAASLTTGRELWRQQTVAPFADSPGPVIIRAKPVMTGLLLCRRSALKDSVTFSLHDASTGKQLWQQPPIPTTGALPYHLATDDTHVYLGSESLQALRLTDGTPAWSFGTGRDMGKKPYGFRRYGIPTVADGVVYAVEGGRSLVAVDARTGAALWTEPPYRMPSPTATWLPRYTAPSSSTWTERASVRWTPSPTAPYGATRPRPTPSHPTRPHSASTPARNARPWPSPSPDRRSRQAPRRGDAEEPSTSGAEEYGPQGLRSAFRRGLAVAQRTRRRSDQAPRPRRAAERARKAELSTVWKAQNWLEGW